MLNILVVLAFAHVTVLCGWLGLIDQGLGGLLLCQALEGFVQSLVMHPVLVLDIEG